MCIHHGPGRAKKGVQLAKYDFVVTIVGTPAAPVSSNANQGVLIGSLGFTVKAGLPTGATGHLTADGEVVCTDDTTRPLSGAVGCWSSTF